MSEMQTPENQHKADHLFIKLLGVEIRASGKAGVIAASIALLAIVLLIIAALHFGIPISSIIKSGQSP
ncbi:MAG: hypothetical protein ACFB6R_00600 [Alphaproteobacteria bacterium]